MCVFLTIGLSLKLPVFSGELVWIIFTPKLCIIAASLTMDTLAISNEREREEIALLAAPLTGRPDGGNCEGRLEERRDEETIKDQMSSLASLTQKYN